MKIATLIIILSFHCSTIFSQHSYIPFAKPDKYWFYTVLNNQEPAPRSENAYVLWTKDYTNIGGKDYLNIYKSFLKGTHPCQFPPCFSPVNPYVFLDTSIIGYLNEDTLLKSVYFLPEMTFHTECANFEREVLNFNLNVDDTISRCLIDQFGGFDHWFGPYGAIDTIEEGFLFGKMRKTWSLTLPNLLGMPNLGALRLIEGIGLEFYDVINFNDHHIFIDFCEGDLFQCQIASSTNQPEKSYLKLNPNPTQGLITIDGTNNIVSAKITDVSGRSNTISVSDNEINISNFQPGIYFVELTDVNNNKQFSKVIKL